MKKIFITATGTGIGKTFISAGIAGICLEMGLKTAYMKPVRTGAEADDDPAFMRLLLPSLYKLPPALECPYSFPLAASPHLSAKLSHSEILPSRIISSVREIEKINGLDLLLIEGAGGVYVPLNADYTILNLIKELNVPALIVGLPGLGAINHTMLTVSALINYEIPIAGIIFNQLSSEASIIENDNIETIERLSSLSALSAVRTIKISGGVPLLKDIMSLFDADKIGQMIRDL
ncbi:MAG: dethiobiotin synthase [Lentisphaerae bacterium GWF2_44_16]|nr:MAG: dethiobiotin synthase [Lentisphaerae bacterium GWF2_44_16]